MGLRLNYRLKIGIILALILVVGCDNNSSNSRYAKEIQEYRKDVIDFFEKSQNSPIYTLQEKIVPFYYDPNPEYRVEAFMEKFENPDTLEMLTTKSDVRNMIRYGKLKFKLNDDKYELTAYVNIEHPESLFIPFLDKTSGKETYEAGRYLDMSRTDESKYILDFNLAYNPYCYYNAKYSCPIVPEDNYLDTKIEAGEKAHNETH